MIFDFSCECGKEIEKFVKNSSEVVECPACGAQMQKQLSAPADFKCAGTAGFYKPGANFRAG